MTVTDTAPTDLDPRKETDPLPMDGIPPAPPAEDTAPAKRGPGRPRGSRTRKPAADKAPDTTKAKAGRKSADDILTKQLVEMIALGFGVGSAVAGGDEPGTIGKDLAIVAGQAEPLAAALVKVSKTNSTVRKTLEMAVTTGAYSELLTIVLAGIAMPIMANHGLLPPALGALYGQAPPLTVVPDGTTTS